MRCALLALAAMLAASTSSAAQNRLVNPEFDEDLSGWTISAGVSYGWGARDVFDSPGSGSAGITNRHVVQSVFDGMLQCLAATEGDVFDLGGWVYVPSGQDRTGDGSLGIFWRDGPCPEGASLGSASTERIDATDEWRYVELRTQTAPPGTRSVLFGVDVFKHEAGGAFAVDFDSVFLAREGAAFRPAPGDLVVADGTGLVVKVDPESGVQRLVASGDLLQRSTGVAVAADRTIYAVNQSPGQLLAIDPGSGAQTEIPIAGDALDNPRDVEVAADGSLYAVGNGLWRIVLDEGTGTSTLLHDLADFQLGLGLLMIESSGGVSGAWIAANMSGVLSYDAPSGDVSPFAGTPTQEGNSISGVWAGVPTLGFFFTERTLQGILGCDAAASGAFAASIFGVAPLSLDDRFRCPRGLGGSTDALYVADAENLFGSTDGQIVEVDLGGAQTLLTRQGFLRDPIDVEVVPEPERALLLATALVALGALARRGCPFSVSVRRRCRRLCVAGAQS